MTGLRVPPLPLGLPPFAEAGNGEGGCFVGSTEENGAAVGLSVVDAEGNPDAHGVGAEIMILDLGGGQLPFDTGVLEVANQLSLLGVHAQHRIAALFKPVPLTGEIAELTVAVATGTGGNPLAVGAEGILHLPEKASHGIPTDHDPQTLQLPSDVLGGLTGPFQSADRIAGGFPLHQLADGIDYSGRFFSTLFRPPPTLRMRPNSTSWASSWRRPLATVCGSIWSSSAI